MKTATNVYSNIDLFKLLASILIVCVHTHPLFFSSNGDYYLSCLCRIAVPFFFCFSSYIFYHKNNHTISYYVKRMLKLYLAWFLLEIPFIYIRFFYNQPFSSASLYFIRGLLIHNTFYAAWYITASWQAMLIVYILAKYRQTILLISLCCICIILSSFNAMYSGILDGVEKDIHIQSVLSFIEASNSFIVAIPYVAIGKYIADRHISISNKKIGIILFFLFAVALFEITWCKSIYRLTDSYFSLIPITFFLTLLLLQTKNNISFSILKLCRNISILIFLTHPVIEFILQVIFGLRFGPSLFLTTLTLSIIVSMGIIRFSDRYPILKNLM